MADGSAWRWHGKLQIGSLHPAQCRQCLLQSSSPILLLNVYNAPSPLTHTTLFKRLASLAFSLPLSHTHHTCSASVRVVATVSVSTVSHSRFSQILCVNGHGCVSMCMRICELAHAGTCVLSKCGLAHAILCATGCKRGVAQYTELFLFHSCHHLSARAHTHTHTPAQPSKLVLVRSHQQVLRHRHVQSTALVLLRE